MPVRIRWFFQELKRRKVTRTALVYAGAGFATLEAVQLLSDALGIAPVAVQVLAIAILCGFPVVLVLGWVVDITPQGVRRQSAAPAPAPSPAGRAHWSHAAGWVVAALALSLVGWQALGTRGDTVLAVATLDEIDAAVSGRDWIGAFTLARALGPDLPESIRDSVWQAVSAPGTLVSDPPGALASWRPLDRADAEWEPLGATPVEGRFPRALIAVRLELEGHETRVVGSNRALRELTWKLQPSDDPLPQALHVPGGSVDLLYSDASLDGAASATVGDYLIDRYEVTNGEYQRFVDAGGYRDPAYWQHPFERAGRVISWDSATAAFVDRTGRPGPSTWYMGAYPDGTADHPVTGVSWYEAAAYAAFAGRDLPTIFHWYRAAGVSASDAVVPSSNYGGQGLAPVGQFPGISPMGASDMAGNAREWVVNRDGDLRHTLGGGWDDASYTVSLAQPQPPFDRSRTNGFRLITDLGERAIYEAAARPVRRATRDYTTESPASDELFEAFRQLYDYDRLPLDAVVEAEVSQYAGVRQKISFSGAYGGERMVLYLFLPERREGPLQTVLYIPGSSALRQSSIDEWSRPEDHINFLTRSGRAVALPVLKSTFEREDDYEYRRHDNTNAYRDHVLMWVQDIRRTLDYLVTRPDLDPDGIGYFGYSWGGFLGPIALAVEPRIRAGVFYVAGLALRPTQPVVDQLHFAPRVEAPVLMLNGEFDHIFPLDRSARPLYELLGSEEKRQVVAPDGHNVPGDQLIRETLAWLDRHLGPIP